MWEIVRAGGPLMWPIILCSITAAAIILERLWTLQDKRVLPQELPQKVWQLIESNQITDKVISALEQNSPLGRLLATGLANRHRPREILMERLEDTGRHVRCAHRADAPFGHRQRGGFLRRPAGDRSHQWRAGRLHQARGHPRGSR